MTLNWSIVRVYGIRRVRIRMMELDKKDLTDVGRDKEVSVWRCHQPVRSQHPMCINRGRFVRVCAGDLPYSPCQIDNRLMARGVHQRGLVVEFVETNIGISQLQVSNIDIRGA